MTKEEYNEIKRQLIQATKYGHLSKIIDDIVENISKLQSLSDEEGDDVKFESKVSKDIETSIDMFKKEMADYLTNLIAECKAKRREIIVDKY